MTGSDRKEGDDRLRLADLLVEGINATSDDEILAEFKSGEADQNAASIRALFEKALIGRNKQHLADAKASVAAGRAPSSQAKCAPLNIEEARRLLLRVQTASAGQPLTLAARKETELSDADVLSIVENLRELGVITGDEGKDM
jgi:hypothetical protein